MASFSAELRVAGYVIPLIRCTYSTHQSTDARGRVITKARKSPIDCEADVPEHQVLDAWAADAHKRQEAIIVFFNADTGTAWETLHLKAAYCVRYTEVFVMGDVSSGSYRCFFTLSDPDGWSWHPGGPPHETAIRPPAREHGSPKLEFEREVENIVPNVGNDLLATHGDSQLPPALEAMIGTTFHIEDLGPFVERVKTDLQLIYATPNGKSLLHSLHASGKRVTIDYAMGGNEVGDYDEPSARFSQADGVPGAGTNCCIGYNPTLKSIGRESWATRPPAIALAHELIHAEQAAYGRMRRGRDNNGLTSAPPGYEKSPQADVRELEAVGVPPYDGYAFTENKIRGEWNPPQPQREYY